MMVYCDDCGLPARSPVDDREEVRCRPCDDLVGGSPSVRVAPLALSDLELVLAWRSHPRIYAHFRQQDGPLDWEDHVSWFESRDQDRYDFVINFDGRRVGIVNISSSDEVGIFLGDFSAHGKGVATVAMEWLCRRFANRSPLFAEIYEDNAASKHLFERCGFERDQGDAPWLQYRYDP